MAQKKKSGRNLGSQPQKLIPYGPLKEETRDWHVSDLITRGSCKWNKEKVLSVLPDFIDDILSLKSRK